MTQGDSDDERPTLGNFIDFWQRRSRALTREKKVQCPYERLLRSGRCSRVDSCISKNGFAHGKHVEKAFLMTDGQVRRVIGEYLDCYGSYPKAFVGVVAKYRPK